MGRIEGLFSFRSGGFGQAADEPSESSPIPRAVRQKALFLDLILEDEKDAWPNRHRLFIEH
jgi:hypothetical protein